MSEQNDATLPRRRKLAAEALGIKVPNAPTEDTHDPDAARIKIEVAEARMSGHGRKLTKDERYRIEHYGYSALDVGLDSGLGSMEGLDPKSHRRGGGAHRASRHPITTKKTA